MSKTEEVLCAMVHDAVTLTDADVSASFDATRKNVDRIREEKGLEPYTEEDWRFIRNFYELFYRAGFSDAHRRLKVMLDRIAETRKPNAEAIITLSRALA